MLRRDGNLLDAVENLERKVKIEGERIILSRRKNLALFRHCMFGGRHNCFVWGTSSVKPNFLLCDAALKPGPQKYQHSELWFRTVLETVNFLMNQQPLSLRRLNINPWHTGENN